MPKAWNRRSAYLVKQSYKWVNPWGEITFTCQFMFSSVDRHLRHPSAWHPLFLPYCTHLPPIQLFISLGSLSGHFTSVERWRTVRACQGLSFADVLWDRNPPMLQYSSDRNEGGGGGRGGRGRWTVTAAHPVCNSSWAFVASSPL